MNISRQEVQGSVPVTILRLQGDLDANSYLDVIAEAREAYQAGARNILVDMSQVPFMASSGLVALHSVALLMRGEEPPDPEEGWGAFHAIAQDVEGGYERHCKLLKVQPRVNRTLEITGFTNFLEVYDDQETAIASFQV